jgi:hypothetical protein
MGKINSSLLREREEGGRKVSSREEERELGLCLRVEDLLHLTGLGLGLMWMVKPKTTTPNYFLESQQESVAVTWLLVHTLVDFLVSCILLIAYSLLLKKCNLSPKISLIGYEPCLMKQMSLVRIFPFPSLMWTVKKKKKMQSTFHWYLKYYTNVIFQQEIIISLFNVSGHFDKMNFIDKII